MEGGIVLKSARVVKLNEREQAQAVSLQEFWTGNSFRSPFVHYWLFKFLFSHWYPFTFSHVTCVFLTINFILLWPSQNCRCLVFRKYPCVLSSADLHNMLFVSFLTMFIKMLSPNTKVTHITLDKTCTICLGDRYLSLFIMSCFHQATVVQSTCQYYCHWL